MRVVLHPGMTKAGSTTIQRYFSQYAKPLVRGGIGYVAPHGETSSLIDRTFSDFDRLVAKRGAGLSHVVVSHESIFDLRAPDVDAVVDGFEARGCTIRVLVVVRPFGEWATSTAKQRAKSLRGFRPDGGGLRVDRSFETWLAEPLNLRLERPVDLVPLSAPGGIVGEFLARSGLPMPEGSEGWTAKTVNRSPVGVELGLYAALNEAIAQAVEDSASGADLLEVDEVRDVRGFLGRLISRGDHHRQPIRLDIDEQFRLDLLHHFISELETLLLVAAGDPQSRKRVQSATRAAKAMLKPSDEGRALARKWESDFLNAAVAGAEGAEAKLRAWCDRSGRRDVAELLLPA